MIWTLIIVTSVKYVSFAMRVDNDGEGGILALMSLLGVKRQQRPAIVALGLFGAALIYGDGAITPAISVLSALEGLDIVDAGVRSLCAAGRGRDPVALFAMQPLGTARIGTRLRPDHGGVVPRHRRCSGCGASLQHPAVLLALDPRYGLRLSAHGRADRLSGARRRVPVRHRRRGALCRHGPFRRAGRSASPGRRRVSEPGAQLCRPGGARARQARRPATNLLPAVPGGAARAAGGAGDGRDDHRQPVDHHRRLLDDAAGDPARLAAAAARSRRPRSKGYGQIYVGAVNWLLMIVTLGLTIGFGKSDNLAAAYGIAVSADDADDTVLLFIAMREIWRWSLPAAATVAGAFFIVDAAFLAANLAKIADGGYVPLLLAAAVYGVMLVWHVGARAVSARLQETVVPIASFMARIAEGQDSARAGYRRVSHTD